MARVTKKHIGSTVLARHRDLYGPGYHGCSGSFLIVAMYPGRSGIVWVDYRRRAGGERFSVPRDELELAEHGAFA